MYSPAYSCLFSQKLKWKKIENRNNELFLPIVSRYPGFIIEGAYDSGSSDDYRFLRLKDPSIGRSIVFIKLVKTLQLNNETLLQSLCKNLSKLDVAISSPISVININSSVQAELYNWLDFEPIVPGEICFFFLGREVAKLHKALSLINNKFNIEQKAKARVEYFNQFKSPFIGSCILNDDTNLFYQRMKSYFFENSKFMEIGARPCHGDLNLGNICFNNKWGFIFIDFEEALHSFFWPGLDLAKIIERVLLPNAEYLTEQRLTLYINNLVSGYTESSDCSLGRDFFVGNGDLARAMRWHLAYSSYVMADNFEVNGSVWNQELNKFMTIELLVDKYQHLL